MVQESLTNALRHAPGAPVDVVVAGADGCVEIDVRNGPAVGPPSGLERSGGGRGLTGMRERVAGCGGVLDKGPAEDGGWRVAVRLPRQAPSPGGPPAARFRPAADAPRPAADAR